MTEIELPVIEFRKTLALTIYRIVFVTTNILFFLLFIIIENDNNLIGKLFLGVMLTFIVIRFLLPKSTTLKGRIRMSKYDFVYCLDGQERKYPLSEVSEITLLYDGYAGRTRTISMISHDSGDDNKLTFKYKGLTVSYNIRIEHKYLGLIRKLISEIQKNGKTVRVLNSYRKEINL